MTIHRLIYTLAHRLAMPLVLGRTAVRASANRDYLRALPERFGFVRPLGDGVRPVWIHAVSVGEVQAAAPIVQQLRVAHPELEILVTTTTPTGRDRARHVMPNSVHHRFMPFDLPGALRRFLKASRPRLLVIMETELWPNLLAECQSRQIPVLLVNVRLSARSARGYRRFSTLTREMLAGVDAIATQSQADATRMLSLGADVERVQVTGSVKFDVRIPASVREQGQVLRRYFGTERSVLVAASTHEGEEQQVLDAFQSVLRHIPDCLLVLVPRHPERFAAVAALTRRRGYATVLRSKAPSVIEGVDVFVGDTMGELPLFYAASDVAFVGGSLADVGGHNVLEPAALGLPVLVGPNVFNFSEIVRMLVDEGACWQVRDAAELGERARALLMDANLRHNMGERARQVVERNRGALGRVMSLIEVQLGRTDGAS